MPEEIPRLLALQAVAEILGISPHTVRAFVRQGRLSPCRICRRLLFDPREVARFLEQARAAPPPEHDDEQTEHQISGTATDQEACRKLEQPGNENRKLKSRSDHGSTKNE